MPKRKAASRKKQADPNSVKKARTAAASAGAAVSKGEGGSRAARVATHTLKLVNAIKTSDGSYVKRMRAVVDLLKEDVVRTESLLNLSLVDGVKADKYAAQRLIYDEMLPLKKWLLRSFDPATVDTTAGNNALHELGRLISLDNRSLWDCKLAALLIDRGVSVHARNKEGRTPLLQLAATRPASVRSADGTGGMLLLLKQGADLNVQDSDGNGVLHHLILCGAAEATLKNLLDGDGVAHLDHTLRNNEDQTADDLAELKLQRAELQWQWVADSDVDEETMELWQEELLEEERRAIQIQLLVDVQMVKWTESVRPELLRHLETALPVTDLAKLTLGYIDGSGRPSDNAAAESESDEDDEPAAAAAAAAQS